ncbi:hypothetical protein H6F93_08495 [Leptolyngbya sp. FACHB-671]|uniref:hypothetical protein n=1 Tax=Leptolyngbya sp. FACHB-671 TaxID=2692812 RepID=UPI001681E5B7|nr:hypothetical protein [Leptolyngbya sp. FACHB-671]MBD2067571.1 hypothetical protein [Leptolyngbya sp. FACHB-671]
MTYVSTGSGQVGVLNSRGVFRSLRTGPVLTDIAESKGGAVFGVNFGSLFRINRRSGAATRIGSLGTNNMNALEFDAQGRLYGAGGNGFYRINTNTGRATLVSRISRFNSSGDIAYDARRNRFFATSNARTATTDDLFSITPGGRASRVGAIGRRNIFGLDVKDNRLLGYTPGGVEITISMRTGRGTFKRNLQISSPIFGIG